MTVSTTRLCGRVVLLFLLSGLTIVNATDERLNPNQSLTTVENTVGVPEEPTGKLALPQALAIALLRNPELSAYSTEIRAQESAILQASLLPNPVFGANAANFGNNVIRGFDGDVVTLQLSQLIELGGKRAARITAADLTKQLAGWDYEAKRADILTLVTQAFIDVLITQQRLALTQQMQALAQQTYASTAARVQAGTSNYLMPNDYALLVGFSLPLPVFDRNQGRIGEVQQRLAKAEEERRNAEVRIQTALNTAYQRLAASYAEVNALHQDILPNAETAYNAASEGYRLGKFGFLDVLDAQRTLFSAQSQHLQAEAEYHKALADVERLIGGNPNPSPKAAP